MGLDVSTTERGVTVCATDNAGTAITIELTPWEAICLADNLRGRSQAHAVSGNIGTHRSTKTDHVRAPKVQPAPMPFYDPYARRFTSNQDARATASEV